MERFMEMTAPIEAMQFTGSNADEIVRAFQGDWKSGAMWLRQFHPDNHQDATEVRFALVVPGKPNERCEADSGDWVCRDRHGNVFVVHRDQFEGRFIALAKTAAA